MSRRYASHYIHRPSVGGLARCTETAPRTGAELSRRRAAGELDGYFLRVIVDANSNRLWHLVPRTPLEQPPRLLLVHATPLLEEERDLCAAAMPLHAVHPRRFHRARLPAALASDDDPVDSRKVEFAEFLEQRLHGQESRAHGSCAKFVDPRQAVPSVFDADSPSDVRERARVTQFPRQQLPQPDRALGEHLERAPMRAAPWSEQPEPGWGGWFVVAVVVAWQAIGFIALVGQHVGGVGCVGVLGVPFVGTVLVSGAAWPGAGIRFNLAAWITACVIGIPCSLGFCCVFGSALNSL